MGFNMGMMTGLLNANAALGQAQIHQRTASHLESRANILETEIKSGLGDVEGKQAELEEVHERQALVQDMQMQSLSQASSEIGTSLMPDDDAKETLGKKDEDDSSKTVSDKAKDEADRAAGSHSDTNVAAVDYKHGIHVGKDGQTNVAVAPRLLEAMADNEQLFQQYNTYIGKMQDIQNAAAQTEGSKNVHSQIWSVSSSGQIAYHASAANAADAAAFDATRLQIDAAGRQAFGDAFAGAYVQVQSAQPANNPDNVGLLISTSV